MYYLSKTKEHENKLSSSENDQRAGRVYYLNDTMAFKNYTPGLAKDFNSWYSNLKVK